MNSWEKLESRLRDICNKVIKNGGDRDDLKEEVFKDKKLKVKGWRACEAKAKRMGLLKNISLNSIWPPDLEKKLKDLCEKSGNLNQLHEAILKIEELKERGWDACQGKARREGWLKEVKTIISVDTEEAQDKFFVFLCGGKTIIELKEKFDFDEKEILGLLTNPPKGKKIYKEASLPGVVRYYCIPELDGDLKKRIWKYVKADNNGPAVDIVLPNDIGWRKEKIGGDDRKLEKIRIVPLADIWFGHDLCDEISFKDRLSWIAREPHVFCFFNGDGIHPMSVNNINQKDKWDSLCQKFYELLAPISHKLLWAQGGCFEDKMAKTDFDPMEIFFSKSNWDIPYFQNPISVGIHWSGNLFKFYCIHGRSQAQKKGSKINALLKILAETEFNHFFVMSHIRDSISAHPTRVVEDVYEFNLAERKQYALITPSFVKYDGSREAKWGYPLPSRDQVNCVLFKDGDYHLYRSTPTSNLSPL